MEELSSKSGRRLLCHSLARLRASRSRVRAGPAANPVSLQRVRTECSSKRRWSCRYRGASNGCEDRVRSGSPRSRALAADGSCEISPGSRKCCLPARGSHTTGHALKSIRPRASYCDAARHCVMAAPPEVKVEMCSIENLDPWSVTRHDMAGPSRFRDRPTSNTHSPLQAPAMGVAVVSTWE